MGTNQKRVVMLKESGGFECRRVNHNKLRELLAGEVTSVGGNEDLGFHAVGRRYPSSAAIANPWCSNDHFEAGVRGDVVIIHRDTDGEPCDVDMVSLVEWVSQHE